MPRAYAARMDWNRKRFDLLPACPQEVDCDACIGAYRVIQLLALAAALWYLLLPLF